MALIAIAVYDTEENDRMRYTVDTLLSLYDTVDHSKHRIILIDNNSCSNTKTYINAYQKSVENVRFITLKQNIGTAGAINQALRLRKANEVCIKMDNDVVVHQTGWVDELESVFLNSPCIGICGLKRHDVYGDFTENGKLLMSEDVMGTCTAFNPKLLDSIGYLSQISKYGFDDTIFSARSIAAGFKNCYLPHIKITHLDIGGTEYTEWKKREAGLYLNEVSNLINMYKTGKLNPYYDGDFNED